MYQVAAEVQYLTAKNSHCNIIGTFMQVFTVKKLWNSRLTNIFLKNRRTGLTLRKSFHDQVQRFSTCGSAGFQSRIAHLPGHLPGNSVYKAQLGHLSLSQPGCIKTGSEPTDLQLRPGTRALSWWLITINRLLIPCRLMAYWDRI
jgi:hypothetical protein